MPSSVTHAYFAEEVYRKLSPFCQSLIKSEGKAYRLFAQGSDPFMFYHLFVGKGAKMGKKLQHQMHTEKTRDFFVEVIRCIHQNHLDSNAEVMAYLYGYICHYYLDLLVHPFINYQSGKLIKEDKSTYCYNTLHQKIEYRIDSYIIKNKLKKDPKKFKVHHYLFGVEKFSQPLKMVIQKSIGKVYHVRDSDMIYWKSVCNMKHFFYLINYDSSGIKRKVYQTIDFLTPKWWIRLEELSYHTNDYGEEYLNLEHEKWCFPWDNSQIFTTSFFDLFDEALEKTVYTIQEVTKILEEKRLDMKKLNALFLDLSYVTGLPCQKKVMNQYFKEVKK